METLTPRASSAFAPTDLFGQILSVGDLVVNFDQTARVVEIKSSTTLVVKGVGLNTRAVLWGQKWLANPAMCSKERA